MKGNISILSSALERDWSQGNRGGRNRHQVMVAFNQWQNCPLSKGLEMCVCLVRGKLSYCLGTTTGIIEQGTGYEPQTMHRGFCINKELSYPKFQYSPTSPLRINRSRIPIISANTKNQNGELWSVTGNQAWAQEHLAKNSWENRRFKLAHSEKRVLIETQILIVMNLS